MRLEHRLPNSVDGNAREWIGRGAVTSLVSVWLLTPVWSYYAVRAFVNDPRSGQTGM